MMSNNIRQNISTNKNGGNSSALDQGMGMRCYIRRSFKDNVLLFFTFGGMTSILLHGYFVNEVTMHLWVLPFSFLFLLLHSYVFICEIFDRNCFIEITNRYIIVPSSLRLYTKHIKIEDVKSFEMSNHPLTGAELLTLIKNSGEKIYLAFNDLSILDRDRLIDAFKAQPKELI